MPLQKREQSRAHTIGRALRPGVCEVHVCCAHVRAVIELRWRQLSAFERSYEPPVSGVDSVMHDSSVRRVQLQRYGLLPSMPTPRQIPLIPPAPSSRG